MQVIVPDGSKIELPEGAQVKDLALKISPGLAKHAIIGRVNDHEVDLTYRLSGGDRVEIVTDQHPLGLETLRHSAAHLMAEAILAEFPGAQLTIGPVVEDGFYYDIHLPEGVKITEEDFPRIEKKMQELVKKDSAFERCVARDEDDPVYRHYWSIDGGDNKFKREIVEGLKANGALSGKPDAPEVSFYRSGDFIDLCRGPHVPSTKWLKNVRLMRVSGAYWRADASREPLTRVYGTAFFSKEDLQAHLHRIEEAKKRDHRLLGEQLDLFHFSDDAPAMPFFHPKGAIIFNLLAEFMRAQLSRRDYQEVRTPLIYSDRMWHQSGHYENYLENMFFTKFKERDAANPELVHDNVETGRQMAVKPMNCPGHTQVYRHRLHSYQDLPLRMCEMAVVHRRELSGVRMGLFRVQHITQDDAHHFCTPDQIEAEIRLLIDFFHEIYAAFELHDVALELSTRPAKSVGSDEMWEKAEAALTRVLDELGRGYKLNPGDGAFYGPKIDFHIRDAIGRTWQCGTIQVDFSMPERFGLEYVGSDGARHTPVMIHRACYGSLERFFGIITEHFAGAFPLWLAPVQVRILPVADSFADYARDVDRELLAAGLRSEANLRDGRLGYKIREATMQKIPYVLVVGEKEVESRTVNVRSRDHGDLGALSIPDLLDRLEPRNVAERIASLQVPAGANA
ncbi:MAG: threonine--tRNA ligase [Candidatus Eisenbacteria bacterium]|uniref:Threonine--tRNA ligase n=1 Tax=Eiseniibacteriota bacterium TaxID=2212470 RepID=A0A956LZC3_UNCEI|nr:threonine--tRNA ligase [Candidatus Eisenbacteria bacterium]